MDADYKSAAKFFVAYYNIVRYNEILKNCQIGELVLLTKNSSSESVMEE